MNKKIYKIVLPLLLISLPIKSFAYSCEIEMKLLKRLEKTYNEQFEKKKESQVKLKSNPENNSLKDELIKNSREMLYFSDMATSQAQHTLSACKSSLSKETVKTIKENIEVTSSTSNGLQGFNATELDKLLRKKFFLDKLSESSEIVSKYTIEKRALVDKFEKHENGFHAVFQLEYVRSLVEALLYRRYSIESGLFDDKYVKTYKEAESLYLLKLKKVM